MRPWTLLLLLAAGCNLSPWTKGEVDEAYRLCRAEIGFPPISVFSDGSATFSTFMCRCEVEYLAERVAHQEFTSGLHLDKVNRVLASGRTDCMVRHRDGER
jgi:hypothetical protein